MQFVEEYMYLIIALRSIFAGAVLPLGDKVARPPPRANPQQVYPFARSYAMSENEYIVFDAAQVCIRYIVQFKM